MRPSQGFIHRNAKDPRRFYTLCGSEASFSVEPSPLEILLLTFRPLQRQTWAFCGLFALSLLLLSAVLHSPPGLSLGYAVACVVVARAYKVSAVLLTASFRDFRMTNY